MVTVSINLGNTNRDKASPYFRPSSDNRDTKPKRTFIRGGLVFANPAIERRESYTRTTEREGIRRCRFVNDLECQTTVAEARNSRFTPARSLT